MVLAAASLLAGFCLPTPSRGQQHYTVDPGWDLFVTSAPDTLAFGYYWEGVPLGTYNFGGSIGVQNVGNTDTILQRNGPVVGSAGSTSAFTGALVALQLQSVGQINLGAGLGYYYITLQSTDGTGPASTDSGEMYFDPDNLGGWFTDTLDVFYDVHYGSLTGPIVYQGSEMLANNATINGGVAAPWAHIGDPYFGPVIANVNYFLDESDTSADFWPTTSGIGFNSSGTLIHVGGAFQHGVVIPEPSTTALLGLGTLGLLAYEWRRRTAKT
jgi:hypothetical protein